MDQLTTPWPVSVPTTALSESPRAISLAYRGDAKNQAPDGLNTNMLTYSTLWDLRAGDANVLLNFFRSHAAQSILWTMPRETTPRIWRATSWSRTIIDFDHHQVTAAFEEQIRL